MPRTSTRSSSAQRPEKIARADIPLCVPYLGGNEAKYLAECLETNYVSSVGPFVGRFEREMARYVGVRHAVSTINGTAALHLALLAAGVERDDEVLVSTLSFIAPANAVRYCGAWPVFIDAEPGFWQMSAEAAGEFLDLRCSVGGGVTRNRATGRRIRAIIPVHILGQPVDMDPIIQLARRFGLTVIEDATEGLGAEYRGRKVGTLGDMACLSFNGNKLITTGGGGMVLTSDEQFAKRCRYLSTQAKDDPVEYIHGEIGYNYRLTNLAAALGCAQLERIEDHVAVKRRVNATYRRGLESTPGISFPLVADSCCPVYWLSTVLIDPTVYGLGSRQLMQRLAGEGIGTRPLWQPLHLSPAHRHGGNRISLPVAERLAADALSLPSSVALSSDDQARVVAALREAARSTHD